jgi:hypothetical protein
MSGEHPVKQLLVDTLEYWDHEGTPAHVRETLRKIIQCGTAASGAEIYASEIESKLVFHTCKSRFCTSCDQRATEEWQANLGPSSLTYLTSESHSQCRWNFAQSSSKTATFCKAFRRWEQRLCNSQRRRPHPARLPWRWLRIKTFGTDPC